MVSLPKYPMYKESGASWLGLIPSNWQAVPLKRVATLRSGTTIGPEDINPEGEYPVYGGNGLRGFTSSFTHDGKFALVG